MLSRSVQVAPRLQFDQGNLQSHEECESLEEEVQAAHDANRVMPVEYGAPGCIRVSVSTEVPLQGSSARC